MTRKGSQLNRLRRNADDGLARRNIMRDNGIGTDTTTVAESDRSQDLRARTDEDAIADRRMALDRIKFDPAQGDAMKDNAIIADFRGFTDNDAHAMIDHQPLPQLGSGMNLDASEIT